MGMLAATEGVVTTMPQALINTALGMGTVFIVLVLISFIIYLLKFIPDLLNGSSKKNEVQAPKVTSPVPKPAAPAPAAVSVPKPADDTQLVAVITAAIVAAMEQEGTPVAADGLVIRSIKKRY